MFGYIPFTAKIVVHGGGTRLAVAEAQSLDGWYVGYSPRNLSDCAEGTWDDWVELARGILKEDERRKAEEGEQSK